MAIKDNNKLLQGSVLATIWRNSQPMFIAIVMLLMYELLESGLIALQSAQVLTAFGFTVPITAAMTALAVGTSIRCNNKVVKSSCNQHICTSKTTSQCLWGSGIILLILSLLALTFSQQILALLGSNDWLLTEAGASGNDIARQQSDYINSRYLAWIFLGIIWQVNATLRALNHTKLASNIMVIWLAFKSFLALLLLYPASTFYVDGLFSLAMVHIVADSTFALISLYCLHKKIKLQLLSYPELMNNLKQTRLAGILVIGQQLVTPISLALLTMLAASFNHAYVAAFALIFKIEAMLLIIPMVLTTSMPAIIGINYWSGKYERVQQAYRHMFRIIISAQVLIAVLLAFTLDFWASSLCPHDSVSIHLKHYLTWLPWGYVGGACAMVYQSTLNAKDNVISATVLGVTHRLLLLMPLAWLGLNLGEYQLYPAMMISHLLIAALVWVLVKKVNSSLSKDVILKAQMSV